MAGRNRRPAFGQSYARDSPLGRRKRKGGLLTHGPPPLGLGTGHMGSIAEVSSIDQGNDRRAQDNQSQSPRPSPHSRRRLHALNVSGPRSASPQRNRLCISPDQHRIASAHANGMSEEEWTTDDEAQDAVSSISSLSLTAAPGRCLMPSFAKATATSDLETFI